MYKSVFVKFERYQNVAYMLHESGLPSIAVCVDISWWSWVACLNSIIIVFVRWWRMCSLVPCRHKLHKQLPYMGFLVRPGALVSCNCACVDYFSEWNYLSYWFTAKRTQLLPLTGSNTYACFSSRLLAGHGVTVERAHWTVTPPPAICAETGCPVSSCLYNGLCGNDLRVIVTPEQETQLLLINRATHSCNMQWRGWPPKTRPSPYAESDRSRSNCVRIYRGEPRKLGSAGATPPWDGGRGWPPKNKPVPIGVTRRCTSKVVNINRGRTRKLWSAGAWLTQRNTPILTRITLVVLR